MSKRRHKYDNSPVLVKAAGEYLYEYYRKKVRKAISKLYKFRRTSSADIFNTWFALMLYYLRYFWDSGNEDKESFIGRRWYYTMLQAWRIESFDTPHTDRNYVQPVRSLESLNSKYDFDSAAKQDFMDFEEYEEFEQIVSGMPPRHAKVLRDRVYLGLTYKELAKKHNLTWRTARVYLDEARKLYREKYEEKHERVEENLGSDRDCVRRDSDDHD